MIELLMYIFLLIGAFFILIKSSDYLVESATVLGFRAGLSRFLIGLTIVAIGTSLPELFTSIAGVMDSANGDSFVLGTVIGSNISNILLIFGILILNSKKFKSNIPKVDISTLVLSTLGIILLLIIGQFSYWLSGIFLTFYVVYLYFSVNHTEKDVEIQVQDLNETFFSNKSTPIVTFFFLLSLAGLNLAAKGVVFGIDNVGLILAIPSTYLTLTTVALATSLPEAVVTYTSAKKGEFNLAVGNIIGSNISNVFLITGIVGLIDQFSFTASTYWASTIVLIISTIIFLFYLTKHKVDRRHGIFILGLYSFYIISTFLM